MDGAAPGESSVDRHRAAHRSIDIAPPIGRSTSRRAARASLTLAAQGATMPPMADPEALLSAARSGDERAFRELVGPHQRELRAYCYRMAGSLDDADDLLQDSLLRAWRGLASFEGRSSLRTWLYRVTWSACVDALQGRAPRTLAIDQGAPADPSDPVPPPQLEGWIGPCPASLYADEVHSPEARYSARESITLAFLAALQLLPPKQRAILLARDVLGCTAEECADLFGSSVPSLNSALQRARETIDARASRWRPKASDDPTTRALLARYVDAWERADVDAFVSLLHEDATLSMPPLPMWLRGRRAIGLSIGAMVFTPDAPGAFRLVATEANGVAAFAAYRRGSHGSFEAMALHLLGTSAGAIDEMTAFLDPRLLAVLGLPAVLR
jgi:RNA polymerase sigma-70 factor, ECF subfamily